MDWYFSGGGSVVEERWQTGTVELQKSEAHPPPGMTKAWVRVRLRSTSGMAGQSTLELELHVQPLCR